MKILILANELENLNEEKDSTIFLIKKALEKRFSVFFSTFENLSIKKKSGKINAYANVRFLTKSQTFKTKNPFKIGTTKSISLNSVDVILIRTDPPFNQDYLNATQILDFVNKKTLIINNQSALRNFNEKIFSLKFPNFIPSTLITSNKKEITNFIKLQNEKVVLKPLNLMGGKNIFIVEINDPNIFTIIENLTNNEKEKIVIQEFLPEIKNGDKRIIIINGIVIDFCLYRFAKKNSLIANLARGGTSKVKKIKKTDKLIANEVAKELKQKKIFLAGLDMIGNKITEINITSPTGFVEINSSDKIDLGEIFFHQLSIIKK